MYENTGTDLKHVTIFPDGHPPSTRKAASGRALDYVKNNLCADPLTNYSGLHALSQARLCMKNVEQWGAMDDPFLRTRGL